MAPSISSFRGSFGERRSMMSFSIIISLSCIALFTQVVEGKVLCYVCSWQSPTTTYGAQNMTDTCSHYHFNSEYAATIECPLGCEAVSIRKSRNENVVNFYKNCIPDSKEGMRLEDKCTETEENSEFRRTCECTSHLCNAARRLAGLDGMTITLMTLALPITIVASSLL